MENDKCDKKDIVELVKDYYQHILTIASFPDEIRTSKYFDQFEKEVNWLYRDGRYRYRCIQPADDSSQD